MALFTYSMEQMRSTVERFVRQSTPSYDWATVTGINPLVVRRDSDLASIGITPQSLIDKDSLLVGDRVYTLLQNRRVLLVGQAKGGSTPWVPVMLGTAVQLGFPGADHHHVRLAGPGLVEIAIDMACRSTGNVIQQMPEWSIPSAPIRTYPAANTSASSGLHIDINPDGTAVLYGSMPNWVGLNMMYSIDRP